MAKVRSRTTPKQSARDYQLPFTIVSIVLFILSIIAGINASVLFGDTILTNFGLVAISIGLSIAGLTAGIAASVLYLSKQWPKY